MKVSVLDAAVLLAFLQSSSVLVQSFSVSMSMMSATTTNGKNHVVVVGSANTDLTSYTANLPVLGETVMGQSFATGCGGKGANQANAAASVGISPVTMVCRLGSDAFSEQLLNNFRAIGVQVDEGSAVLKHENAAAAASTATGTGVATIVVDTKSGDNMIIVTPGANHKLKPADVRMELHKFKHDPPAIVVVQLEILPEAALEALKVAKEMGAMTVLNPAPAPEDYNLDEFFPFTDILIPNESELRTLCGEREDDETCDEEMLAKSLLAKGVGKAVIVTLGARGAMIVESDATTYCAAPDDLPCKDDPIEDTIGAGDAFCGSLSTYMSAGVDMRTAAKLACGFAGMSVRRKGATYPSVDELPDCLRVEQHKKVKRSSKPTLTFVTGNKNKLSEVQAILCQDDSLPVEITNRKIDLPETQGDPVEIAKEKCRIAAKSIRGPCFTEDTALCFNALNGLPGPYIKWFLEKLGHEGLNKMLDGFDDRSAYAQTIIAYCSGKNEDDIRVFEGRTEGKIVAARGSKEFGWDPIFEPNEGSGKTYAEMAKADKNKISHRGRALEEFRTFLMQNTSKSEE